MFKRKNKKKFRKLKQIFFKKDLTKKAKEIFLFLITPKELFYILILVLIAFAFYDQKEYGINWDALLQRQYGTAVFYFYKSFGKDLSILKLPLFAMNYYGPFFELILVIFEKIFRGVNVWYLRNLLTSFSGILGIYLIGLCGFEFGDDRIGFLSALSLALFPRFLGIIAPNTKDVPFLTAYIAVLYFTIRLIKRWDNGYIKESIFVGVSLAIAITVRNIALIWLPMFPIIAFVYWGTIRNKDIKKNSVLNQIRKQIISYSIILILSLGLMVLLWPYVLLSPINHLMEAVNYFAHFPPGVTLFEGTYIATNMLPWNYSLIWFSIATPIATIVLFVLGLGFLSYLVFRKSKDQSKYIWVAFLAGSFPLFIIALIHSTLYNGIRQILFVVPPLILFGSYGFIKLLEKLKTTHKILAIELLSIVIIGFILTIIEIVKLYPFEYVYYNSLVGGVRGASSLFELDYDGVCYKQASEWLNSNFTKYTKEKNPTFYANLEYSSEYYTNFKFPLTQINPDFYVTNIYATFAQKYSSYKIIHTISVDNTDLCRIELKQ